MKTLTDVWTLETPQESSIAEDFDTLCTHALQGSRGAQNILKKLWGGETWQRIKEKLETEGSVWYVWYMDGLRKHMSK